jgi:hypothetical protein
VSGDDRSWNDGGKRSFSELDRLRREGRSDGERRPRGKDAQERSKAGTKQYLREIDGAFAGGLKAEVEKLATAMRDAHGTPGLADACRAYQEAAGLPSSAPLISLFLDSGERELILAGLAALRESRDESGVKVTSSLRSQLRMLAEDPDDETAETAAELLEGL